MQRIGIVDLHTGEVLEDTVLVIGKSSSKDKGFVKVFVAFLDDVVANEKIAGKAVRLLLYMLKTLDYNSLTLKVKPKRAIQELGIDKATYYRWIKDLVECGILEKEDAYTYRLKPYSFVKGSMRKVRHDKLGFDIDF